MVTIGTVLLASSWWVYWEHPEGLHVTHDPALARDTPAGAQHQVYQGHRASLPSQQKRQS